MADPFISSARQDFQDTKADLRAAYEAGNITRDQFREAKQEARDVFSGYKGDVRAGNVTDYSNPFASFSPTGIASLAPTPTVSTPYVGSTVNNVTTAVTPTSTLPTQTFYKPLEPEGFDFTGGRTAAPEFNLQTYADVLSKNKLNTLDKLVDIITGGGTLSKQQEGKLGKISGMVGENLATALGYYPTTERYEDKFTQFLTPKATDAVQAQTLGTTAGTTADTVAATTPTWAASPGDLYEALNYNQEEMLSRLAGKYAAGELEGRENKIDKLTSLLDKAGLGTLESYFAQPTTYTAPTDFGVQLPTGVTAQQLADIYRASDPLAGYVAAQRYGLGAQDISSLLGGYAPSYYNPVRTSTDIEDFLAAGKSDLTDYNLGRAYLQNPNAPIFSDPKVVNWAQQVIYAYRNPIKATEATATDKRGETIAGSGQYGYMGGAPILNAGILDDILGDRNRIGSKAFKNHEDLLDELGWNFKSKEGLNFVQRGPQILGLDERRFTPEVLKSMDQPDPESGGVSGGRVQLEEAAKKVGIDPSAYKTSSELYKAIDRATEGLYQVTGQFNQWSPEQGATPEQKANHASVLYREVNGQLIPITDPNFFQYKKPKDPLIGGFVGDVLGSVPFLAEIAGMASGNPAVYAALKGAQTASRSGDIGDVAISAGLAYLAPKVANSIAGSISSYLPAGTDPLLAEFATKAGTNAAMNLGIQALTGQNIDIGDMLTDTLLSTSIDVGAGQLVSGMDLPKEYRAIAAKIIADALRGKDMQQILSSAATRAAMSTVQTKKKPSETTEAKG